MKELLGPCFTVTVYQRERKIMKLCLRENEFLNHEEIKETLNECGLQGCLGATQN